MCRIFFKLCQNLGDFAEKCCQYLTDFGHIFEKNDQILEKSKIFVKFGKCQIFLKIKKMFPNFSIYLNNFETFSQLHRNLINFVHIFQKLKKNCQIQKNFDNFT